MKVWHLISNRWNSAITEYALSAARALEVVGHESVFTPLAGSPAETRAARWLRTRSLPRFTVAELPALTRLARELRPDVAITYGGPETLLMKALGRPWPRLVARFRGQALDGGGLVYAARHRLAHAHVDLLVTPSAALAAGLKALAPWTRVACVPLGLDTEVFRRVPPRRWPPDRPELVVFGRFDPVKGHGAVMRLYARVLSLWGARAPRPRLHVVGEPANLQAADVERDALAAGLRLGDDVVITPRRIDDVAGLLSSAALGVVPSLGSEIICRVAEEFLLCGTPVAVSGVGSLDEVLAFAGAGVSWRGLGDAEAAARLVDWVGKSLEESPADKDRRAAEAVRYFSLRAMGEALAKALG